jgi:CPA2 family monovalent cation:H+ antiporter-2
VVEQAAEQGGHHGDALIWIAFAIAVAALLGLGFMRLKQPPLVGFILAGLLLGPTGMGVISSSENVALLAEMGVVVLLFFIGMELSIKAFVRSINQAVLVAGGQLVASMASGGSAGLHARFQPVGNHHSGVHHRAVEHGGGDEDARRDG